jgi:hypothetical protein
MNAPPVTSTVPAKANGGTASLTRAEREDLLRLAKMRERVAKTGLAQRSAQLLAEFEQQMASEYSYDQDTVWKAAAAAADREVKKAKAQIAERCRELGIPDRFAPGLHLSWYDRGENAVGKRRTELRFVAKSRSRASPRSRRLHGQRSSGRHWRCRPKSCAPHWDLLLRQRFSIACHPSNS